MCRRSLGLKVAELEFKPLVGMISLPILLNSALLELWCFIF